MKNFLVGALVATGFAVAPTATAAVSKQSTSKTSITLRATVPVVCHTTFSSSFSPSQDGYRDLGTVNEFCNSANGYRVIIEIGGSLEDAGTIYFGGEAFPVTSNRLVVTDVNGPGRLDRALGYIAGENEISEMRIRIEPKYA